MWKAVSVGRPEWRNCREPWLHSMELNLRRLHSEAAAQREAGGKSDPGSNRIWPDPGFTANKMTKPQSRDEKLHEEQGSGAVMPGQWSANTCENICFYFLKIHLTPLIVLPKSKVLIFKNYHIYLPACLSFVFKVINRLAVSSSNFFWGWA